MPRQKTVFIASSGKAKALAKPLALYLTGELPDSDIREWYDQNTFPPSKATLDGLLAQAGECDFAIVLLTRDDFLDKTAQLSALGTPAPLTNDVSGKGNQQPDAPRDNTIFELGMFMGALGAERCFMVCSLDENSNALPSDLKGIKYYKIEPPADLSKADECRKCVKLAGAWIVEIINQTRRLNRPELSLITRDDLSELEKGTKEGGKLVLAPGRIAVVVNSVEPVEETDTQFSARVLKNMQAGARYEYFYGDFSGNIDATINLIVRIATTGVMEPIEWSRQPGQVSPPDLEKLTRNLRLMRQNLSIHFRKRPPVQFCIHNALSEEWAICYLRYQDAFVKWNEHWEATQIATELTQSCTVSESDHDACIFHSTSDVRLTENASLDASTTTIIRSRRDKILRSVKGWFPVELEKELNEICLGS